MAKCNQLIPLLFKRWSHTHPICQ